LGVFTINIYFKNHNNTFVVDNVIEPIKNFNDLFSNVEVVANNPQEANEEQSDNGQSNSTNSITDPNDAEMAGIMAQLRTAADSFKTAKGTYVGFISAADGGHDLVTSLNNLGGEVAVAYTSKTKYCISKKLPALKKYVCIDNSPYSYISETQTCNKQTFLCGE
jgi:hypothetical protein